MASEINPDLNIEIQKALEARKGDIVKGLVEGAIQSLNHDLGWRVKHAASEVIDVFMKTDVLPKVQEELEGRKAEIVSAMVTGIEASFQKAIEQMAINAAKNLAQSWNMKKITDAMFG